MPAVPFIVAATAVYSAASSADNQRKALNATKDAQKASQVDIDALNEQTKTIAKQNALESAALERQLTPEVPQLRTAANNAVLGSIAPSASEQEASNFYRNLVANGTNGGSPLLAAAAAKAYSDLNLGGRLDTDTQNLVTRSAIANSGAVAGANGGIGLGRDVTARDLGLTSLQIEQQRLENALTGGRAQQDSLLSDITARLNGAQAGAQLNNAQFNRALSAAQYGEAIQQPKVGLDPTAIANLKAGQATNASAAAANQANIFGAQGQSYGNAAGNLFGGLLAMNGSNYGGSGTSATPYTTAGGGSGYSPQPWSFYGK